MKKYIKIFAILSLSMAALSSCDLTLTPEDKVTPENYFKTESDLLLWSNQFYADFFDGAGWGATTDLFQNNGISAYVSGNRNPATQSWSFAALRQVNYMLGHLDQCTDKAAATKYEAVGRFFRALFYANMVRTYGDVPYYDKVLESDDPDVYKARDDRGYVMDKVLEDYDFAAKNLPSTWESMNTRVTKWAAMGFASRAALYEGTFRKYHNMADADKYLAKCVEFAKNFVSNSPYSLNTSGSEPYRDLFISGNVNTKEVVLCRHYDVAFGSFHSMAYNNDFSNNSVTRRFMNHYLMKDGSRFTDKAGWQTMFFTDETKDRDPRMAQTICCPGYVQKGAAKVTACDFHSRTGYYPIKHIPEASKCLSSSDDQDWCLLRAAEVYLNYAEALAELGTLTQTDLDISVNKIRSRAGMPALSLETANANPDPYMMECYPNVTKSANTGVILEIRRERTVELCFEDPDRQWDMFRWAECKQCLQCNVPWYGIYVPAMGKYDTSGDGQPDVEFVLEGATVYLKVGTGKTEVVLSEGTKGYMISYYSTNYGTGWDDARDYLWPIPATQRTLNHNLTQNPGYVDGVE